MASPHLSWDVSFLKNNPIFKDKHYGIPEELKSINYPIRLVRYWFMYHLLRQESQQVVDMDVCEIGVDVGQMLGFVKAAEINGGG
jgi:hypothetical protein